MKGDKAKIIIMTLQKVMNPIGVIRLICWFLLIVISGLFSPKELGNFPKLETEVVHLEPEPADDNIEKHRDNGKCHPEIRNGSMIT